MFHLFILVVIALFGESLASGAAALKNMPFPLIFAGLNRHKEGLKKDIKIANVKMIPEISHDTKTRSSPTHSEIGMSDDEYIQFVIAHGVGQWKL